MITSVPAYKLTIGFESIKKLVQEFLDYYRRKELIEIFDKAMKGEDPSTLFDKLRIRKDNEYKIGNK